MFLLYLWSGTQYFCCLYSWKAVKCQSYSWTEVKYITAGDNATWKGWVNITPRKEIYYIRSMKDQLNFVVISHEPNKFWLAGMI